ncbi:hypothetical protein TNCV_1408751 [Trichonephila clavipes]|uniref:Uncharacterized protein n=1 Tax=Trichonephila clavipes TaxID=2585209 RepID=A0A8X6R7G7_TRICX|nr:hypothetical protein TNCV_1408751 [Trichonephila clavipes]
MGSTKRRKGKQSTAAAACKALKSARCFLLGIIARTSHILCHKTMLLTLSPVNTCKVLLSKKKPNVFPEII